MNVNDHQVGGEHYRQESLRGNPQHWDLVIMYQWDYFQAAITKYLMRWKTKYAGNPAKQLEDLKKSRHYLDKYIEEYEKFLEKPAHPDDSYEEGRARLIANDSNEKFQCEGWFGDLTQEYKCKECRTRLRAASLEEAERLHHCQIPL